jgi:tripartite motif-containing protein 71
VISVKTIVIILVIFLWIASFYDNDNNNDINYFASGNETDQRPSAKWGTKGTGDGEFNEPHTIAFDPVGNAYVTDLGNNRVQKFDSDGNFITKWGTKGTGDGEFNEPHSSAVDKFDNIYVSDMNNNRVQKFDSDGNFITKWGTKGTGDGQFRLLLGIDTDSFANVYVVDQNRSDIQKFDMNGDFLVKLKSSDFSKLEDIELNSNDYMFITDRGNHNVQKYTNPKVQ